MGDAGDSNKRKASGSGGGDSNKRSKTKKQWSSKGAAMNRVIQPGDTGIWATCDKGREGKCTAELKDLFNTYAEDLYSAELAAETAGDGNDSDDEELDLEASIKAEVAGIKRPTTEPLFTPIKMDVQCVLFFRTRAPIEPVSFVRHICRDALNHPERKRTRYAKRFSPVTLMGRASEEGLEAVAKEVLAPHFHGEGSASKKFAIRPTLRNHNVLKRDTIIQKVASLVGPGHKVDLKNYDKLIVVEAYKNVCGMSVVPDDFEELKRYNIAEIFDPTPKELPKKKEEAAAGAESAEAVPEPKAGSDAEAAGETAEAASESKATGEAAQVVPEANAVEGGEVTKVDDAVEQ